MDSNNNSANMKLEPGIQALVFGLVNDTQLNGSFVTVLQKWEWSEWKGIIPPLAQEGDWLCAEPTGEETIFNEKNLMPIRPEEDPLEITDVITKKEKA